MNKLIILIVVVSLVGKKSTAQMGSGRLGFDQVYAGDKRSVVLYDKLYIINGRNVVNPPFLYPEWQTGTLNLENGYVYNQYTLRYDVYEQKVYFNNGSDSLEIDQPLISFTLNVKENDSVTNTKLFKAANQVGDKKNKNRFYEVVYEDEFGAYLKYNYKTIQQLSYSLPNGEANDFLEWHQDACYYNKTTNKFSNFKNDNNKLSKELMLGGFNFNDQVSTLGLLVSDEKDIITLLKKYKELNGAAK
jgi:hypothetical protein